MTEHFTSKAEGSHKSALRNQNKTAQITEKKLLDLFKQKKTMFFVRVSWEQYFVLTERPSLSRLEESHVFFFSV